MAPSKPGVHDRGDCVARGRDWLQYGAVHARGRAGVPAPAGRARGPLVDVFTTGGDGDQYATNSYPDFQDLKAQNDVFSDMLAYSPSIAALKLTDRSRLAMGETVTGNYFQLLGVKAKAGRLLMPDDDKPGASRVAVISYRLWNREYAASPAAVGRRSGFTVSRTRSSAWRRQRTPGWCRCSRRARTPMTYVDDVEPGGIISNVPSPTGNTRPSGAACAGCS